MEGTGNPWFKADLIIEGNKTSRIEPSIEPADVDYIIDVSGLIVAPGFIDIHSHSDITIFDPDKVQDLSTKENPHQYSLGIEYVLVNGQFALKRENSRE
ncbi:MAG: hypothetical protein QXG44_14450 [Candidatus Jordarchaeaceae archaeon]